MTTQDVNVGLIIRELSMKLDQTTGVILSVGAVLVATIIGTSCSTNARIDDMRSTHDDIRLEMRTGFETAREERQRIEERIEGIDGRVRGIEDNVAFIRGQME